MMTFEEVTQLVHKAGLRMTRPREQLLQLILTATGPFSVKMLHEQAEAAGLNIHLATVHRNLAEFVEVGLVDELPGEDNRLYALHQQQEGGAHIFCLDCRSMTPLEAGAANVVLSEALTQRGFDASTVRLMLAAHCNSIKKQTCPNHEHDCDNPD
ncbi:MAG: transcriptional repressor [Anaerolineae bacterium]|nr:transcriptional repressor [Anaerolineae bacterium]